MAGGLFVKSDCWMLARREPASCSDEDAKGLLLLVGARPPSIGIDPRGGLLESST